MRDSYSLILLSLFTFATCARSETVKCEPHVSVKRVRFAGELIFAPKKLEKEMDLRGETSQAVEEGVARVRSLYLIAGYLDVNVHAEIDHDLATVFIEPGRKYDLPPGLCTNLQNQRREAERLGLLDFSASLAPGDSGALVVTGPVFRVGRIEFLGNHHHSDAWMRRNLRLIEGELFDYRLLRRSLDRLRQTGQFDRVEALEPVRDDDSANVTIRVTEGKRGFWRISGPAGPVRIGGSMQASLGARVFSTLLVSASIAPLGPPFLTTAARLTPVLSLTRPFTPGDGWLSGISIAPQLGWKLGLFSTLQGYGTTQVQQRLLGLLAGNRQPPLPVTVDRKSGDAVMICPSPPQKLNLLRKAATFGVYFLGAL